MQLLTYSEISRLHVHVRNYVMMSWHCATMWEPWNAVEPSIMDTEHLS